jgi:hypothetical protein
MARLPNPPINPEGEIPNGPFHTDPSFTLQAGSGQLIVGQNLEVDPDGRLNATGGPDEKGVTLVNTGKGLDGGPITTQGTISLEVATKSTLGGVITGDNVQIDAAGVISVLNASTQEAGVVKLVDGTSDTSTTTALTANQGRILQEQINALVVNALDFCGTYDAEKSEMAYVSALGLQKGFTVGANIPAVRPDLNDAFVIAINSGNPLPPAPQSKGDPGDKVQAGNWFICDGTTWVLIRYQPNDILAANVFVSPYKIITGINAQIAFQQLADYYDNATIKTLQTKDGIGSTDTNGNVELFLNAADVDTLGGVRPDGRTITVDENGVIAAVQQDTGVESVTGTGSINVDNRDPKNPVVSVDTATKFQTGVIKVGDGLNIAADGTLSAEGSGKGSVTLVNTGRGLAGGPITDEGTINLDIATTSTIGGVVVGDNLKVDAFGVVSVPVATEAIAGVVQLVDNTDDSAADKALSAKQGKNLQDQINALVVDALDFCGTYDASTSQMTFVSTVGANKGFVVGQNVPAASPGLNDAFVIIIKSGTPAPPAPSKPALPGNWLLCDSTEWVLIDYQLDTITAAQVVFGPYKNITSDNVQGAIEQLADLYDEGTIRTIATSNGIGNTNTDGDVALFLNPAEINTLGGIKPDGTTCTVDANGTLSVVGGPGGGVEQIVAGRNISIEPADGKGVVTINAAGGAGGGAVLVTSEITSVVSGRAIQVRAEFDDPDYPGGVFTLFQPTPPPPTPPEPGTMMYYQYVPNGDLTPPVFKDDSPYVNKTFNPCPATATQSCGGSTVNSTNKPTDMIWIGVPSSKDKIRFQCDDGAFTGIQLDLAGPTATTTISGVQYTLFPLNQFSKSVPIYAVSLT